MGARLESGREARSKSTSLTSCCARTAGQLVADAVALRQQLLVATTLWVYKPLGMTACGRRRHRKQRGGVLESLTILVEAMHEQH
jgi:hypothetical protein